MSSVFQQAGFRNATEHPALTSAFVSRQDVPGLNLEGWWTRNFGTCYLRRSLSCVRALCTSMQASHPDLAGLLRTLTYSEQLNKACLKHWASAPVQSRAKMSARRDTCGTCSTATRITRTGYPPSSDSGECGQTPTRSEEAFTKVSRLLFRAYRDRSQICHVKRRTYSHVYAMSCSSNRKRACEIRGPSQ